MQNPRIISLIRLRIAAHDAHYAGDCQDGAKMLHLFGDVATELLIRQRWRRGPVSWPTTRSEFPAPVYAGDHTRREGRIVHVGKTPRKMAG